MKVGDLVRYLADWPKDQSGGPVGLVVDVLQKKCWRTDVHGRAVNWEKIDAEPHAVVLFGTSADTLTIPQVELEVISED